MKFKTTDKPQGPLLCFPMLGGGRIYYTTDQLEQMPKKQLVALRKFLQTPPSKVITAYPKTNPRRRTKTFADGSQLIETAGGTTLVEAQLRYRFRRAAKAGKPKQQGKPAQKIIPARTAKVSAKSH